MSCNEGMVEFIPSEPLSKVLAQYGRNIQNFLRQHHADDTGPFGIEREALDIFIKSLGTPSHSPARRPTQPRSLSAYMGREFNVPSGLLRDNVHPGNRRSTQ